MRETNGSVEKKVKDVDPMELERLVMFCESVLVAPYIYMLWTKTNCKRKREKRGVGWVL